MDGSRERKGNYAYGQRFHSLDVFLRGFGGVVIGVVEF